VFFRIERQGAAAQNGGFRVPTGSPENGFHPFDKLARTERLDHVIVGADGKSDDAVDLLGPRGQHQHRHLRDLAQFAAEIGPIHAGQVEIEHHETRVGFGSQAQPFASVMGDQRGKPRIAEITLDQRRDIAVVLDNEYRIGNDEWPQLASYPPNMEATGRNCEPYRSNP